MSVEEVLSDARCVANIQLHRSPYVPTDQEADVIRMKTRELRDLDSEISTEIQRLGAQRDDIRSQIAVQDAIVAPCRHLPLEILSEIFLLALPETWKTAIATERRLDFAETCVWWRYAALNTPLLWSTLRLEIAYSHLRAPAEYTSALEAELKKTAEVPLDLSITMMELSLFDELFGLDAEDAWNDQAWALLRAQSHRWEHLELNFIPAHVYANLSDHNFPMLKSLKVSPREYDRDTGATIDLPLPVFYRASHVTNLDVEYSSLFPVSPVTLPHAWSISTLRIHSGGPLGTDVNLSSTLGAITACSHTLRSCTVEATAYGVSPGSKAFPCLVHLDLCHNAVQLCRDLFTAPILESCNLTVRNGTDVDALHALQSMLTRSTECRLLRSLALEGMELDSEESVVACLRRLPLLTKLRLANSPWSNGTGLTLITPNLIHALSRDIEVPSSLALLPKLAWLEIEFVFKRYHPSYSTALRAMSKLLRSRHSSAITVEGMDLVLLEHFFLSGEERWSLPELEDSDDEGD